MSDNTDILVRRLNETAKIAPWWVWFVIDLIILILKCLLSALVAGAIVFLASTQTTQWATLSSFEQKTIWLAAGVAAAKDILSFFSTAISDMQKRRSVSVPPIPLAPQQ